MTLLLGGRDIGDNDISASCIFTSYKTDLQISISTLLCNNIKTDFELIINIKS